jgi:ABC-type Zn uptake system ZnuABC Zn-binding protein ZnuA
MHGRSQRSPRPRLRLDISLATILVIALLSVGACSPNGDQPPASGASGPTPAADAIDVVATTTVLADMVRQVGGARVNVSSLVPPGGEVHTFDPTPTDLARVADAELIVMNGLGLDEWLGRLAADSGTDATTAALAESLEGVEYLEGDGHADEAAAEPGHEGENVNPHLWLNVAYGIRYAERIGEALAGVDPAHAADYEAGTAAYTARLRQLDTWAREQLAAIPEPDRRIVSFHEAFPYFAEAYGLEIVGTVIEVPGQDPSAGEIAALIEAIRESGAKAVFSEAQFDDQLARTIAQEAGVAVESDLYNDSLGEPPADTYEGLIRWDVERVVAALTD